MIRNVAGKFGVAFFAAFFYAAVAGAKPSGPLIPTSSTATVASSTVPIVLAPLANRAFGPGERFKYVIKYQFISAGTASLEVHNGPLINNRPTLHIVSNAQSNKIIDSVFKVRDVNASIVDRSSMASLTFHQNLKEGHYHVMRNTTLDYVSRTFNYERKYKGKTNVKTGALNEPVSDILSSFFYTRLLPLESGKEYGIRVFSDGDVYSLLVKVGTKIEKIKVPAGEFECILLEPAVTGDAIFKIDGGKMYIWLTNDERRIPVLIRSKVALGAFDAELTEISLPQGVKAKAN